MQASIHGWFFTAANISSISVLTHVCILSLHAVAHIGIGIFLIAKSVCMVCVYSTSWAGLLETEETRRL